MKKITLFYLFILIIFLGADPFKISIGEDFTYFLPHYHFVFSSLFHGDIPFWSPYSSLGVKELFDADFSYFYPGIWLVLIINFIFNSHLDLNFLGKAFQLFQYIHLLVGMLLMYVLLNGKFKFNKTVSFIGGLIFGLSPFSTWDLTVISALPGKMLFPGIIYLLINFIEKSNFRNFIILVFSNCLILSLGYPYHIFFFFLAELLLGVIYSYKSFVKVSFSIGISILSSSFFLVSYVEYFTTSFTNPAFNLADSIKNHLGSLVSPIRLINAINPQVYSSMFNNNDIGLWYSSGVLTWGTISLVFLIKGFSHYKDDKLNRWLVILFIIGIIYSLWGYLNIPGLFTYLPIVEKFRSVSRILTLPFFSGIIFICYGLKGLRTDKKEGLIELIFGFTLSTLIIAILLIPAVCSVCISNNIDTLISISRVAILLGLGLLINSLYIRSFNKIFLIIIGIILVAEFSYYYKSDFRQVARYQVSYKDYLGENSLIVETPNKNNLFRYFFYNNQFSYNTMQLNVFNILSHESFPNQPPRNILNSLPFNEALKFMNTKYYVTTDELKGKDLVGFTLVKTIDPTKFNNEKFISSVDGLPYWSEKSKNIHYIYQINNYQSRFFSNQDAQIQVEEYKSSYIKLKINSREKALIQSSEVFNNGWQIKINNKKGKFVNTDQDFRQFEIEKGESTIEMYYLPPYLFIGILISLITFIGIIFFLKKN